jgi:hypothetical protein
MKECKQISTSEKLAQLGDRTTPHENKNLTNKQNYEDETLWLNRPNDNKPLSSRFQKNKYNPRLGWKSS